MYHTAGGPLHNACLRMAARAPTTCPVCNGSLLALCAWVSFLHLHSRVFLPMLLMLVETSGSTLLSCRAHLTNFLGRPDLDDIPHEYQQAWVHDRVLSLSLEQAGLAGGQAAPLPRALAEAPSTLAAAQWSAFVSMQLGLHMQPLPCTLVQAPAVVAAAMYPQANMPVFRVR